MRPGFFSFPLGQGRYVQTDRVAVALAAGVADVADVVDIVGGSATV